MAAFNQTAIERLTDWCRDSFELAAARREARTEFFGDDDDRPVEYWPGAGDAEARSRRFLGYFLFDCVLPSGDRPASVAARNIYEGPALAEVLTAIDGARFIFGFVKSIVGRSVFLECEEEQFEVRSRVWSDNLTRDTGVAGWLLPVRHGHWLPGPGWVNLPFKLGPGIRSNLKSMQLDQMSLERLLESRAAVDDEVERPLPPQDQDLEAAVARMADWAAERGHGDLALPVESWSRLVTQHLDDSDVGAFYQEVLGLMGPAASEDEANEVLGLAVNIWNNTPQPARGGRTANQMTLSRQASSPEAVEEVMDAVEWLTADGGVETISLYGLQRFLWYELPVKWGLAGGEDESREFARVCDQLFVLFAKAGREGLADICRSAATEAVHAAWSNSEDAGWREYRRAMDLSGVDPPELDDFRWSALMGRTEAEAYALVAEALEEARESGALVVGAGGWRRRQKGLAATALESRVEPGGPSVREAVLAERLESWCQRARGEGLRELRAGVAAGLAAPQGLPDGFEECVEPLQWFLGAVGEGLPLTEKHNLSRAFVVSAAAERDLLQAGFRRPRRAADVPGLAALHALAGRMGAVRRRRRSLLLTREGRAMVADPIRAWRRLARTLAGLEGAEGLAFQAMALILLARDATVASGRLSAEVAQILNDEGYRTDPGEELVRAVDAGSLIGPLRLDLELLGLLVRRDFGDLGGPRVTPPGKAMLRDVLWHCATGPVERTGR